MRNKLKECTTCIIHNIRRNRQLKFLSDLLFWTPWKGLGLKTVITFGITVAMCQMGFCFSELKQIEGLDLIGGSSVRVEFKKARLGTVVMFLSSRCPCSASHQSTLDQLSKEFGPRGFRFVGIHSNADEEVEAAREHFKKSGLAFPVIQDKKSGIADALGAFKTPHVFVLASNGEVLFQGGVDNSHVANAANKHYLQEALAMIVDGKKPSQKEVRVLGCEIRR
ncbi:MAG: redoxin family protein [Bdellovibrionia bacterium]